MNYVHVAVSYKSLMVTTIRDDVLELSVGPQFLLDYY